MNTDGNIPFCNPVTASAWERCLAILKPTPAQLQHGLELHQNSAPLWCENRWIA